MDEYTDNGLSLNEQLAEACGDEAYWAWCQDQNQGHLDPEKADCDFLDADEVRWLSEAGLL